MRCFVFASPARKPGPARISTLPGSNAAATRSSSKESSSSQRQAREFPRLGSVEEEGSADFVSSIDLKQEWTVQAGGIELGETVVPMGRWESDQTMKSEKIFMATETKLSRGSADRPSLCHLLYHSVKVTSMFANLQ